MSLGFKAAILILCLTLFYVHRMVGQKYFNALASPGEQVRAVKATRNLDVRNRFGKTGLMFAATKGQLALARALVQRGAHLNLKSRVDQATALGLASYNLRSKTSLAVGLYLIAAYANTRLKSKAGNAPVHQLISTDVVKDRVLVANQLIKNGANINAQNNQGDTPMHLAVNLKDVQWTTALLNRYGPILNLSIKNKRGLTPREYAKQLGYGDLIRVTFDKPGVRARMPKANAFDKNGLTGLMLAIMAGGMKRIARMANNTSARNMQSRDQYRNTALHTALMQEHIPAVKLIVDKGALLTVQNSRGEIPAQFLVRINNPKQRVQAATLLFAKNPQTILTKNNRGENLLHMIVRFDDQPLLIFLIKRYKNLVKQALRVKNKALQNPLQLASAMRRIRIGRMLTRLK